MNNTTAENYTNKILLKGNEAAVYGALLAGCDCFFGYPITPASEIAHAAALLFPRLGRVFVQAESETAAINMVMGASATGRRVMTASSGLGISLKQEGVSYLAGSELPAVIIDVMRGGPGLGNIGPEQSDYNQVIKGGGHGNYRCIVLSPNSAQEMCEMTMTAFDLAEKYRTPVYVLTDGLVGQMLESVELPEPRPQQQLPSWALNGVKNSRNNYITSIFLEYDELEAVNLKLCAKYRAIEAAEQRQENYYTDDAELVIIAYGIVSRLARTAVQRMRRDGLKVGLLRPRTLFPFPKTAIRALAAPQLLCIEMSNGQMVDDVKLTVNCGKPVHFYNRMGGNTPSVEEIINKCHSVFAGKSEAY
ncbi:MAG: 3-methyl-2-oxobutanoate dehydrogenase subunit VorB [Victivallales bacterium]|nr:3-methyl-2-oxobutanoate dehydrogenase subunit VorB [Victivallales bacterium]